MHVSEALEYNCYEKNVIDGKDSISSVLSYFQIVFFVLLKFVKDAKEGGDNGLFIILVPNVWNICLA